jgi:hypothetical protein
VNARLLPLALPIHGVELAQTCSRAAEFGPSPIVIFEVAGLNVEGHADADCRPPSESQGRQLASRRSLSIDDDARDIREHQLRLRGATAGNPRAKERMRADKRNGLEEVRH